MSLEKNTGEVQEVPFELGFLTLPLQPRDQVRLLGTKCRECEAVVFGSRSRCENCAGEQVDVIPLSRRGTIWSHTVVCFPPPPPYKASDPFVPLPVAWVELQEGVRVLSYIDAEAGTLEIGQEVELVLEEGWQDEQGNRAIMYRFRPC